MTRVFLFLSMIAAVILSAMLFFTTPAEIGPFGIFVFFVMTYFVMLGITTVVIRIFTWFVLKKKTMGWKDYADAAALAFWPVMVLIFISLGTSNFIFSLVGATVSVMLILFLIRKV